MYPPANVGLTCCAIPSQPAFPESGPGRASGIASIDVETGGSPPTDVIPALADVRQRSQLGQPGRSEASTLAHYVEIPKAGKASHQVATISG